MRKKKNKVYVLKLTKEEAVQVCINLGAQSGYVSEDLYNSSINSRYEGHVRKPMPFRDMVLYNVFNRLDNKLTKDNVKH